MERWKEFMPIFLDIEITVSNSKTRMWDVIEVFIALRSFSCFNIAEEPMTLFFSCCDVIPCRSAHRPAFPIAIPSKDELVNI
jgi:hypothetical protein